MPRKPAEQCSPYPLSAKPADDGSVDSDQRSPGITTVHQRHGDRASGDDANVVSRLPVFVRFRDLRRSGIADNWQSLGRLIEDEGFPPGVLLSPNIRAWRLDEVEQWLATRPVERKPVPYAWPEERKRAKAAAKSDARGRGARSSS